MISTSIRLLRIQLLKDFGINEVMHCQGCGEKTKAGFHAVRFHILRGAACLLCRGAAWVLCVSGAQDSVPGFVVAVSSMAIFIFTLFKAGPVLFAAGDYEMLTALPLKPSAIIMSRLLHMYLSSLLLVGAYHSAGRRGIWPDGGAFPCCLCTDVYQPLFCPIGSPDSGVSDWNFNHGHWFPRAA